jgi:hypothetical protein
MEWLPWVSKTVVCEWEALMQKQRVYPVEEDQGEYNSEEFQAGYKARQECASWASRATRSWRAGWSEANAGLIANAVVKAEDSSARGATSPDFLSDGDEWLDGQFRETFGGAGSSTTDRTRSLAKQIRGGLLVLFSIMELLVVFAYGEFGGKLNHLGILGFLVLIVTFAVAISWIGISTKLHANRWVRLSLWLLQGFWLLLLLALACMAMFVGRS